MLQLLDSGQAPGQADLARNVDRKTVDGRLSLAKTPTTGDRRL